MGARLKSFPYSLVATTRSPSSGGKPENRGAAADGIWRKHIPTFPILFSSLAFCLLRSQRLSVLFVCAPPPPAPPPLRLQSPSECVCFWGPPLALKGLNRPFSRLSTFPGSPGGKSLLEFCSPPTLVSSPLLLASCNIHDNRVGPFSRSVGPLSGQKDLHLCAFERVM